ncbi:MAG TPA: hypothetical protein VGK38_11895 [Prolixibacteraceae bacterium]
MEHLSFGNFYHIYNRGINSCDIFRQRSNYEYFLELYNKHISTVADTYAWVLMKNHFHLLVKIKEEEELNSPDRVSNPVRALDPSKQFSNLFNSYAQAFNKRYMRHGNLFERPFKRKLVDDKEYLKYLVVYIHNNPVHHGFTQHAMDYPWSSYLTCISKKQTHLHRDEVMCWFENEDGFKNAHEKYDNEIDLEKWLGI